MDGLKYPGWFIETDANRGIGIIKPENATMPENFIIIPIAYHDEKTAQALDAVVPKLLNDLGITLETSYKWISMMEPYPSGGFTGGGFFLMLTQSAYQELAQNALERLIDRNKGAALCFKGVVDDYERALEAKGFVPALIKDIAQNAELNGAQIERLLHKTRKNENFRLIPCLEGVPSELRQRI